MVFYVTMTPHSGIHLHHAPNHHLKALSGAQLTSNNDSDRPHRSQRRSFSSLQLMQLFRPYSWCLRTETMASMNVLVGKDLGAKLADSAGGSIDGSLVLVAHGQPSVP